MPPEQPLAAPQHPATPPSPQERATEYDHALETLWKRAEDDAALRQELSKLDEQVHARLGEIESEETRLLQQTMEAIQSL